MLLQTFSFRGVQHNLFSIVTLEKAKISAIDFTRGQKGLKIYQLTA